MEKQSMTKQPMTNIERKLPDHLEPDPISTPQELERFDRLLQEYKLPSKTATSE